MNAKNARLIRNGILQAQDALLYFDMFGSDSDTGRYAFDRIEDFIDYSRGLPKRQRELTRRAWKRTYNHK